MFCLHRKLTSGFPFLQITVKFIPPFPHANRGTHTEVHASVLNYFTEVLPVNSTPAISVHSHFQVCPVSSNWTASISWAFLMPQEKIERFKISVNIQQLI